MAKVLYVRLCREVKKNTQTGRYSLMGKIAKLTWMDALVSFVFVVYWHGYSGERFSQSFTLMDEMGNILNETPTTECELNNQEINISTAFFYTTFPHVGRYHVNIYQNGFCTKTIPLHLIDARQSRVAAHNDEAV